MESFAAWLTDMFLRHGIVTQEQAVWCQYMLLKKLLSFTICFLMVLLGTLISGFWPALLFAGGLGFLAKRTNGYHAHTPLGCAAVSVLFEAVAMWILPRFALEPYLILLVGAPVCVLGLAPVNNKQIHLSEKELGSIAWRARLRLFAVAPILPWYIQATQRSTKIGRLAVSVVQPEKSTLKCVMVPQLS